MEKIIKIPEIKLSFWKKRIRYIKDMAIYDGCHELDEYYTRAQNVLKAHKFRLVKIFLETKKNL